MACALIFICMRADGYYLCHFSWICCIFRSCTSYIRVSSTPLFPSFSLFSYVYLVDLFVIIIPIVYLEVYRLPRYTSIPMRELFRR